MSKGLSKVLIRDRNAFPKCIRFFSEVRGICIGNCIASRALYKVAFGTEEVAHAHSMVYDKHNGWICLRYKEQLNQPYLLLHEVAHLLVNKKEYISIHGKKWRDKLIEIGGTVFPYTYFDFKLGIKFLYPGYDTRGCLYYS